MVQYVDDGDLACFDGLSFRRDKKTGYFLNAKTHKRLHVYVWEYYNGSEVPKGYNVHHKNFDKNNNEIENLVLMTAKEHSNLHGSSWSEERREWARENLAKNARPKASKWHGSEEGKKWHSQHAEKNLRQRQRMVRTKTAFAQTNANLHIAGRWALTM